MLTDRRGKIVIFSLKVNKNKLLNTQRKVTFSVFRIQAKKIVTFLWFCCNVSSKVSGRLLLLLLSEKNQPFPGEALM